MVVRAQFRALTTNPRRLEYASAQVYNEVINTVLIQANQTMAFVREYPPEVTNQRYRRTFTLRESWEVRGNTTPRGFIATIANNAIDPRGKRYAAWVHGGWFGAMPVDQQEQHGVSRISRGGGRAWRTMDDAAASVRPVLRKKVSLVYTKWAKYVNKFLSSRTTAAQLRGPVRVRPPHPFTLGR